MTARTAATKHRVIYQDATSGAEYLAEYAALMETPTNRLRIRAVLEHLAEILPPHARVLDVACGGGAYLQAWQWTHPERPVHAYGVDRGDYCTWAFQQSIRAAHAVVGDATQLPFAPSSFDVILAMDIVEHLEDDAGFLVTMHDLLKPGGTLLLLTQNLLSLENLIGTTTSPLRGSKWVGWDPTHLRFYSYRSLAMLLARAGLSVVALDGTYYIPFHFPARVVELGLSKVGLLRLGQVLGGAIHQLLYATNYPLERWSRRFPLKYCGWGILLVARRGDTAALPAPTEVSARLPKAHLTRGETGG